MSVRVVRRLVALLAMIATGLASACPVCVVGPGLTPAQWLINADAVLLALPDNAAWKTLAVVKGRVQAIPDGDLRTDDVPPQTPMVAYRDAQSQKWRTLGALPVDQVAWLRHVAASTGSTEMTPADWQQRVAFHLPYLEHPVALMAETAYAEIARAPYSAMRTLKPRLDARRIESWQADPRLAARTSLYTMLLGIAGGASATALIDRQVTVAQRDRSAAELAALLVADMELRGPARVAWLEQTYLTSRDRSVPEVQAALLALSVHGDTDGAVARGRVVEAYRRFIRSGHQLAGYAAPDLMAWKDWIATPDYVALLKAKVQQHPASIFAMLRYLDSSPNAEARAAAAAFRKEAST